MSTTLKNFCVLPVNIGGAASNVVVATSPQFVNQVGTAVDRFQVDLSVPPGYAKNGSVILALAASTPVTLNLTTFATNSTSAAGDTSFAVANELIYNNFGSADVVVSPATTNPFLGPLNSSATFTVPAGSKMRWQCPAGWTVSSTVNSLTFESTAAANIAISVGGS